MGWLMLSGRMIIVFISLFALARGAEVCCPNIGCFENRGEWFGMPVPECPDVQEITFELFTRSNTQDAQLITRTNIPSVWDGNKETVFLIHGWNNNKDTTWLIEAKDAILEKDDKNVVIVGWGVGANRINYLLSAANTRVVGAETRQIKDALQAAHGSAVQVYCVGHSLGAHTCGHMGQYSGDRGVNRISGLDPAGPMFESYDDRRGLNKNCADLVEAWHTDGKDSINSYGTLKRLGHQDFYPNGADVQPGCLSYYGFMNAVEEPERYASDPLIACSHSRATKYFITSVSNDCFRVRNVCTDELNLPESCSTCLNCPSMGYVDSGNRKSGIFYLGIFPIAPHCVY